MDQLHRNVKVFIGADSEVTFGSVSRTGLAVFSTDTERQARDLQIALCSLARDGSKRYFYSGPEWDGSIDCFPAIEERMAFVYASRN